MGGPGHRDLHGGGAPDEHRVGAPGHAHRTRQRAAVGRDDKVAVTTEFSGCVPALNDDAATHLYRIAQESVSNGVKHGGAKHVRIGLTSDLETLRLTIKDDGIGIGTLDPQRQGMGLRIMHYRAGMIGARLAIEKQRSGGTRVTCSLPKEQNETKNP